MYNINDNIVALATLPGKSALNVVRVSGEDVLSYYKHLTKKRSNPKPRYANLSSIYSSATHTKIDHAVITYFPCPKSFTGENMLEISIHGGLVIAKRVINELVYKGAREALPGEFSYRAFVNNKIDLIQAESIMGMIESASSIDSYYNLNNILGALSSQIKKIKSEVVNVVKDCEYKIDFDEEELNIKTIILNIKSHLKKIKHEISAVNRDSYNITENSRGIRVAIIGKPNVGKSSLFNIIIKQNHSIISNIAGTTRDIIEKNLQLGEIDINLIDTAGIRDTSNKIELLGIRKTYEEINKSKIILVLDDKNPKKLSKKFKNKTWILVRNKSDLKKIKLEKNIFHISCKNMDGIDKLITHLSTIINKKISDTYKRFSFTVNQRQQALLNKIDKELTLIIKEPNDDDLIIYVSKLYFVIDLFNELYSPNSKDKIINEIFSGFCVGK